MKRFSKTLAAALIIVATAAAFMVGCKKEQMPQAIEAREDETTLARIMDFKCQLEAVEATPNEKTAAYMSVADAVWNIEALFNYTYAYPGYSYGQTICCDTTLYMPVCTNDSVSLADLYVFNCQMYDAVLMLYQAALLDNKQFIILDVEAGERNGNLLAIEIHTLQGSMKGDQPDPDQPHPWRPFMDDGILWFYGEDHVNSNGFPADAADTLTGMLNANLVSIAPEGYEYVYIGVMNKYTVLGENHPNPTSGYTSVSPRYCEFFKENPTAQDYWLNSDQMNYYYFGERHLVLNILPNRGTLPVPSDHCLFRVVVGDGKDNTSIGHYTTAFYGIPLLVSQESLHKEIFQ